MNKDSVKSYFTHTLKERKGTIIIIFTTLIGLFSAQYIYPLIVTGKPNAPNELQVSADSLRNAGNSHNSYAEEDDDESHAYSPKNYNKPFTGTMFYFDPNTLDAEGWRRLGIRERTIEGIGKYLSKGGRFRDAASLRKIWGLSDEEKERLIPYVRIAEGGSAEKSYSGNYQPYEKKVYEKKAVQAVDINSGDSAAFVDLPGIGPGFAGRILKFRNKLGGFYKVEQIGETFGLPDSVFQKIKPFLKVSGDNIHKININTATNDELKAHPYIRWQLAKVITEYKKQHGNFKSLEDLKKIMIIDEETYKKISPYLDL